MKCCICNKEIKGYGHNARPLFEGKCCDDCNLLVITVRSDMRRVTDCSTKGKCSRCGQCCTDFIPLTQEEILRIKIYMKTHKVERNYCTDAHGNYLVLCPFLSEEGCQIYPVRPKVCQGFCCWKTTDDIKRNKISCLANAIVNGDKNFVSLHAIFWDDWEFNSKLIRRMIESHGRRVEEENEV